jgi:cytochrome c biogenesis protein CcdA
VDLPVSEVLALAVAVAASPFAIIPAILVLFTDRPRPTSMAYLVGWFTGLALGAGAFVLLAGVIELGDEPPTWSSWARVGLGLALIALGVRKWFARATTTDLPAWMSSIESLVPGRALVLSAVLALANPKILLLSAAAGTAIGSGTDDVAESVALLGLYCVIGSLGVAVPVLGFLLLGERALRPLQRGRDWLERHNAAVMAVVLVVIGAALAWKGLAGV